MKSLCVHIGSKRVTPHDPIRDYYCRVYGKTPGYLYPSPDFFEIPTWIPALMGRMSEAEAKGVAFQCLGSVSALAEHGSDVVVYGSVMDTTLPIWRKLADWYPTTTFGLGGYVDPEAFKNNPNVVWSASLDSISLVDRGPDYRLFRGWPCIPRLQLSSGCTHKCNFCMVPRVVTERPLADIVRDVDSFRGLAFELVYIDDKTFGQAKNWTLLAKLGLRIKLYNPDFDGFVVQTTATQVLRHAEDWAKNYWVRYIETGVETLDDTTLRLWRKPHTAAQCWEAARLIRRLYDYNGYRVKWIPNLIFGIAGDERGPHDYIPTVDAVSEWRDWGIVPFVNPYILTQYADARGKVARSYAGDKPGDSSENTVDKSWLDYRDREAASEALETVLAMF